MTKMSGSLYPRGFFIKDNSNMVTMDKGHQDIDRMIDYMFSGKVNSQGFSYYKEVFPIAMTFFGDVVGFLCTQKLNPFLYGYNYEFLLDTINFIQTGNRKVSIHNWKPLLAEWVQPITNPKNRVDTTTLDNIIKLLNGKDAGAEFIAQWCSHPQGFEDMVMTMWLMFGSSFDEEESVSKVDRVKKITDLFT